MMWHQWTRQHKDSFFSPPPPFSFLEISPKAMLVDNNVSICVYACKYVSVYQLEGELIRALGILLSSHTFRTRTVLPKMEIEH